MWIDLHRPAHDPHHVPVLRATSDDDHPDRVYIRQQTKLEQAKAVEEAKEAEQAKEAEPDKEAEPANEAESFAIDLSALAGPFPEDDGLTGDYNFNVDDLESPGAGNANIDPALAPAQTQSERDREMDALFEDLDAALPGASAHAQVAAHTPFNALPGPQAQQSGLVLPQAPATAPPPPAVPQTPAHLVLPQAPTPQALPQIPAPMILPQSPVPAPGPGASAYGQAVAQQQSWATQNAYGIPAGLQTPQDALSGLGEFDLSGFGAPSTVYSPVLTQQQQQSWAQNQAPYHNPSGNGDIAQPVPTAQNANPFMSHVYQLPGAVQPNQPAFPPFSQPSQPNQPGGPVYAQQIQPPVPQNNQPNQSAYPQNGHNPNIVVQPYNAPAYASYQDPTPYDGAQKGRKRKREQFAKNAAQYPREIIPALPAWGPLHNPNMFRYVHQQPRLEWSVYEAQDIEFYIRNCPRPPLIWLQQAPAQANDRTHPNDRKCRWKHCPSKHHTILSGWLRVAFDEFPTHTSDGRKDPFKMAFSMHLWCFEQCVNPNELLRTNHLIPDTRHFGAREERNNMALNRGDDEDIANAVISWRTVHYPEVAHLPVGEPLQPLGPWNPRPHAQSLAYQLTRYHLDHQVGARQAARDNRNSVKVDEGSVKTIDVHLGDLAVYASRDRTYGRLTRRDDNKRARYA